MLNENHKIHQEKQKTKEKGKLIWIKVMFVWHLKRIDVTPVVDFIKKKKNYFTTTKFQWL